MRKKWSNSLYKTLLLLNNWNSKMNISLASCYSEEKIGAENAHSFELWDHQVWSQEFQGGGGDLLLQAGIMNTEALGVFIWAKTCILTMLRTFLFIRFDFHDENVWFFHEILVISFSYKRKSWRHWCLIAFKGGILWICLHYRHGPDMFVKIAGFNSACTFPPIYSHIIVRNILS